jgi:hypothetical protein
MTILTYLLDHAGDIAIALSILAGVVFPALSRIAKLFGEGPKATAASKLFDGLGLDVGKASRAVRSLKTPTADEIARSINTVPPEDEDTETRLNREDLSK